MDATFDQSKKLLALFEDTPREQIQWLFESGFLTDIRDTNALGIDRKEFRRVIRWVSIPQQLVGIDLITYRGTISSLDKAKVDRVVSDYSGPSLVLDLEGYSRTEHATISVDLNFGMVRVKLEDGLVYVLKDSRMSPLSSGGWTVLIPDAHGDVILYQVIQERLRLRPRII
ncbi:MAG: hypothetical protein Q7K38_01590 [Candidatus Wildermuthbacteria bacterium]|nr:hypothetical protein [Candidatus Wildermuthbacteria bacterium]